jgi:hypothetical protein
MKTDVMDKIQQLLDRHRGKGWRSYGVYILIFLCMLVVVIGKPLGNLLTFNKLKQK